MFFSLLVFFGFIAVRPVKAWQSFAFVLFSGLYSWVFFPPMTLLFQSPRLLIFQVQIFNNMNLLHVRNLDSDTAMFHRK